MCNFKKLLLQMFRFSILNSHSRSHKSASSGMNNKNNSIFYNQIVKEKNNNKISHLALYHNRLRRFSTHFHHRHLTSKPKFGRKAKRSWKHGILCGLVLFVAYFLFLGFITYAAITSQRSSTSSRAQFQLLQNGSNSLLLDSTNDYKLISANGSLYLSTGLVSLEKLGNMQFDSNSARLGTQRNGIVSEILRSQLIFKCVPMRFRDGNIKRPAIALVSFPGSGNTWLRYLIQLATGVFTGSIYKDFALIRNGFLGENVRDSRVLTVKTHESGPTVFAQYDKAVLLIRKPAEAIQAEFNRYFSGHVGQVGLDKFAQNNGSFWSHFVYNKGNSWTRLNFDWIEHFDGPLLIMMYSQLVSNISNELKDLLEFLQEPITPQTMNCALKHKEGIYRRRKKYTDFNPFTLRMEAFLAEQELIVAGAIERRTKRRRGGEFEHKYSKSSSKKPR